MTPKDQNIYTVLSLLTLLHRSRKALNPNISEDEQAILTVTKEYLDSSNLSVPVFANTLKILADRGYLMAITLFDKKLDSEIRNFLESDNYEEALRKLELEADTTLLMNKFKEAAAENLERTKPATHELDREALMNEELSLREVLNEVKDYHLSRSSDDVSTVLLFPYRSIDRLLEKMNEGIPFDEVQDEGFWYDHENYMLHIGDDAISTKYGTKPNIEHFILSALFKNWSEGEIDFDDIPEFDDRKNKKAALKSFRDALNRFVKKHPELPKIFLIHKDYVELNKDYLKDSH